jgi:hypothetical protein
MRNKPTVIDGIRFASKKEAKRYSELNLLMRGGEIYQLDWQTAFTLEVKGMKICRYIADFVYRDSKSGRVVVEDCKGRKAGVQYQMFRLKAKLMKAVLGIEVIEI